MELWPERRAARTVGEPRKTMMDAGRLPGQLVDSGVAGGLPGKARVRETN
jgi:hypothetical protein